MDYEIHHDRPPMTWFIPLFTTARVVRSIYQIVLTLWLLYYLIKRIHGRKHPDNGRVSFGRGSGGWAGEGQA